MTTFTEGPRTAGFLISEANGFRSRATGDIAAGVDGRLEPGTVVGIVTANKGYAIYDADAEDGTETVAGILFEGGVAGDSRTIVVRDAEVKASQLVWFAGATANQIAAGEAALAGLGIIVR